MVSEHAPHSPPVNGDPRPWERQHGESWPAFEAFQTYLKLGGQRSIREVARVLAKNRSGIEKWCRAHEWIMRVDAWNAWLEEEARKRSGQAWAEVTKRHAEQARALQAAESAIIQEFARRSMADPNWMQALTPMEFSRVFNTLPRSMRHSVEMERQALGIREPEKDEAAGAAVQAQGAKLVVAAWKPSEEELKRLKQHSTP